MSDFSFNTINGHPTNDGEIILGTKSVLRLRLPVSSATIVSKINTLRLCKYRIYFGQPIIKQIKPASTLESRIVVIKNAETAPDFIAAVQAQLKALQINATIQLKERLTTRITKTDRHYTIVGYHTQLSNLNKTDSIELQNHGIGGKRRLGCGVFVAV
jgi:CRISPR-associated endonuclease/helicase Cas3